MPDKKQIIMTLFCIGFLFSGTAQAFFCLSALGKSKKVKKPGYVMPMQAWVYPQNHYAYQPVYPSQVNRQAYSFNRYSRLDNQPVALHQTGAVENSLKDYSSHDTSLPSIAPETDARKRFSFFD